MHIEYNGRRYVVTRLEAVYPIVKVWIDMDQGRMRQQWRGHWRGIGRGKTYRAVVALARAYTAIATP